jgi:pyrimidine deaminase RibD-like protein
LNTQRLPQELAFDLARKRSPHPEYRMGAVIVDTSGRIISWGWNHMENGRSVHCEIHALNRANPRRLRGATLFVAGWTKGNRPVLARPCDLDKNPRSLVPPCLPVIRKRGIARVVYSTPTGFETLILN